MCYTQNEFCQNKKNLRRYHLPQTKNKVIKISFCHPKNILSDNTHTRTSLNKKSTYVNRARINNIFFYAILILYMAGNVCWNGEGAEGREEGVPTANGTKKKKKKTHTMLSALGDGVRGVLTHPL